MQAGVTAEAIGAGRDIRVVFVVLNSAVVQKLVAAVYRVGTGGINYRQPATGRLCPVPTAGYVHFYRRRIGGATAGIYLWFIA